MTTFNDFLGGRMKDAEFRKEYEALEPEFAIIQAIIDARKNAGLTQKRLSEKTGISQGGISKLETGNANPSIRSCGVWRKAWAKGSRCLLSHKMYSQPLIAARWIENPALDAVFASV